MKFIIHSSHFFIDIIFESFNKHLLKHKCDICVNYNLIA